MPNRKRNRQLVLRLTNDELELFRIKCANSKMKQADFFLLALDKTPIIIIEELSPILVELKRQGINLNQAVRNINEGNPLHDEIEKAIDNCNAIYDKLSEVTNNAIIKRTGL